MSTKVDSAKNKDIDSKNVNIHMNPSIQSIFSDQIIKVEVSTDNSVAKLFFGQVMEGDIFHNSTIVIPLQSLLTLKELISSEKFEADMNAPKQI